MIKQLRYIQKKLLENRKKFTIILMVICFISIPEITARFLTATFLKNKLESDPPKTVFEEIYVPPFRGKEPGEFRIFVYGGSTVQGIPLPKAGFVSQLQYQLNEVFYGKDVKVYNLGWAGFNSTRIRYNLQRTIDEKPDLVVIYTGENEFIYPQLDFYWLVSKITALKNRSDLAEILMFVTHKSSKKEDVISADKKFPAYSENRLYMNLKMQIFKNNLKEIVNETKKRNIPLVFGIPAHNIADWPPVRREVTTSEPEKDYLNSITSVNELIEQQKYSEADAVLNESFEKYEDDAWLLYLKAQLERRRGNNSRGLFEKAKDNDLVPWRTTTAHSDFIKSLEDKDHVWVVDFPDIFAASSPEQLVGFNYILDGTHPNKEGNFLIAQSIVDFLKAQKLVPDDWIPQSRKLFSQEEIFEVMGITPADDFEQYLRTAELSLKIPLSNIAGAKFYLEKAEEIDNNNWETKALKATIYSMEGDVEQSRMFLEEAEKLKGGNISREEAEQIPYLYKLLTN